MNKIAGYLNEHLLGEVSSAKSLRKKYASDGGILTITPEIIAFPKVTNDIRKVARFTWQLAEKGHVVPVTVRGLGGDVTGASIGKGIIIDTSLYLNRILNIMVKDRLVHVQPGVTIRSVSDVLKWQGLSLPGTFARRLQNATLGGLVANASVGVRASVASTVKKLEVVLANGDTIETGRISRRDVSKKLGLQTFEGEVYRKLEGLFEDNEELIKKIAADPTPDTTGYKYLTDVRRKDGSFDLTPLFIGSQGTLGIISEMVLKTDFYSANNTHALVIADSIQTARDLAERVFDLAPAELTIFDGSLYRRAEKQGVHFQLLGEADTVGAVLYVRFNDFSERAQTTKIKKLRKLISKIGMGMVDSLGQNVEDDYVAAASIGNALILAASDDHVALPVLNGAYIPQNRREEFEIAVGELAAKHHLEMPLSLNLLTGTYDVFPLLKLDSVSDKQKLFKTISDYATLVDHCDGAYTSDGAEGRLKANAAWALLDDEQAALFEQVRQIFDPFETLNPGVKQKNDIRTLVAALRTSYESAEAIS